jgi:multidrug efflux pump subunit AcrA (membrane-fusion protein)
MTEKYLKRKLSNVSREVIKYSISALILVLSFFAAVWLGGLAKKPATQESDALITQVDVAAVSDWFGTLDLVVPGMVKPHREIQISSEVGGRILKKYPEFQAGSFVLAGTKLAEIDAKDYQADLDVLKADLEQSKKRLEENKRQIEGEKRNVELAENDLAIQQRDFARTKRLASALSRSEVDQARQALNNARTILTGRKNTLDLLKASATRLQSAVTVSENQLKRSQLNLGRVTIVAPVDGVIVEESIQENDFVRVGDRIAMFEDTSIAEVRCNLTTSELNWVRKNSKGQEGSSGDAGNAETIDPRLLAYQLPKTDVTIFEADAPDVQWKGTLTRFDGIGRDEITKTVPCRIIIPRPIADAGSGPRALVRNMYVKCRIEVQTSSGGDGRELMVFDELALQPGNYVWKVVDSKLRKAYLEVVDRTEKTVSGKRQGLVICRAVDGSIRSGDQVVVSPLSQPTDNAEVIVSDDSLARVGAKAAPVLPASSVK